MLQTIIDAYHFATEHMRSGRGDDAEALFRRILEAAPDHAPSLMLLSALMLNRGEHEAATSCLRKALAVVPEYPEAQYNLCTYLNSRALTPETWPQALRTFLLRPNHANSQRHLIIIMRIAGRLAEVEALFSQYCSGPLDAERLRIRADLRLELGLFNEARTDYLELLTTQPDDAAAYTGYRDATLQLEHAHKMATRFMDPEKVSTDHDTANIYVKCYSRPMYLDRCLRSIKANVTGYGRIILLNDGIGPEFMARLRALHPDVEVRDSPKVNAGIIAAPMSERLEARKHFFRELDYLDPARFWVNEISRDPHDHVVIFEEDCWFFRPLAIDASIRLMRERRMLVYAMLYENDTNQALRKQTRPPQETVALEGGLTVSFPYHPIDPRGGQFNADIFPIANTLFDRDYWLNSYEGGLHWTDEPYVRDKAARMLGWLRRRGCDPTIGHIDGGVVRHCRSSTARSDAGGAAVIHPIDPYILTNLLNQLWLEERIDVMAGYPDDLPDELLLDSMSSRLSAEDIAAWQRWREEFLSSYWFYNQ